MAAVLISIGMLLGGAIVILIFALGASLVGLVLLGVLVIGAIIWLVALGASDRSFSDTIRCSAGRRPDFLGPGGADGPDT
jgi:hypothetical protein